MRMDKNENRELELQQVKKQFDRSTQDFAEIELTTEARHRAEILALEKKMGFTQLKHDIDILFLLLLYCRYQDLCRNFLIEFRYIPNYKSGRPFSKFYKYQDIGRQIVKIIQPNNEGYHVYIGINPRPQNKKKEQASIKDIIAIWVDIDSKNFPAGKEGAWKIIDEFPIIPTIIVDSGNGYHLYWLLDEPIIDRTEEESLQLKQIMNGLSTALNADKATKDFSRVMRFPGTMNIKDPKQAHKCQIKQINFGMLYSPDNFESYRDFQYSEISHKEQTDFDYEGKELVVNNNDAYQAQKDIQKLGINHHIRRMIITGECKKDGHVYPSRSERDLAIIINLVASSYNFRTIQSIFLNEYLGCSDRILEGGKKGKVKLKRDVTKAVKLLSKGKKYLAPGEEAIRAIKNSNLKGEEKIKAVSKYIVRDLFGEPI